MIKSSASETTFLFSWSLTWS